MGVSLVTECLDARPFVYFEAAVKALESVQVNSDNRAYLMAVDTGKADRY